MATAMFRPEPAAPARDYAIEEAWSIRQKTNATIEKNGGFYSGEEHSPIEVFAFDAAENIIEKRDAHTLEGALIKLWVGLAHIGSTPTEELRREHAIIRAGDMAAVEKLAPGLDFEQAVIFSAIRSLTRIVEG